MFFLELVTILVMLRANFSKLLKGGKVMKHGNKSSMAKKKNKKKTKTKKVKKYGKY